MRALRLLSALRGPEGTIPAGERIVVEDAEARLLLGAIGLAEDLGEVAAAEEAPAEPAANAGGDAPPPAPIGDAAEAAAPGAKRRRA